MDREYVKSRIAGYRQTIKERYPDLVESYVRFERAFTRYLRGLKKSGLLSEPEDCRHFEAVSGTSESLV